MDSLNTWTPGPAGLAKPLILAKITMSTSCKLKSHGMRRGKSRAPHKGIKRGGGKRKCRKGCLKSRKRGDDGKWSVGRHIQGNVLPAAFMKAFLSRNQQSQPEFLGTNADGCVLTGLPVVNLFFPTASRNYRSHLWCRKMSSALVDFNTTRQQLRTSEGDCQTDLKWERSYQWAQCQSRWNKECVLAVSPQHLNNILKTNKTCKNWNFLWSFGWEIFGFLSLLRVGGKTIRHDPLVHFKLHLGICSNFA